MLISGLLTSTMFIGFFSPESSLLSNFGETMQGPVADVIVRNWSALIGLIGFMLIYGAFVERARDFALVVAGISKITFITLVLSYGRDFLSYGAGTAVVADSMMVCFYAVYLAASTRTSLYAE